MGLVQIERGQALDCSTALERRIAALESGKKSTAISTRRARIPLPGVTISALDDVDVIDDDVAVYLTLSDGSTVAVCLPLDELVRRAHTVISAADAPAMREAPLLR